MPGVVGMDDPLGVYTTLVGGCAMDGAQSLGDAIVLLQPYVICLSFILAALLVALIALTSAPFAEVHAARIRRQLWEYMWGQHGD